MVKEWVEGEDGSRNEWKVCFPKGAVYKKSLIMKLKNIKYKKQKDLF